MLPSTRAILALGIAGLVGALLLTQLSPIAGTLLAVTTAGVSLAAWYRLRARATTALHRSAAAVEALPGDARPDALELPAVPGSAELEAAFRTAADSLSRQLHDGAGERDRLAALLDTLADGLVVIGAAGGVEFTNVGARSLLRFAAHLPTGTPFSNVVHDHDLIRLVEECQLSGRTQTAEVVLLTSRRPVEAVAMPLGDASGDAVLLSLHDPSQARQVDVTRREFVSNVSHELRTPLATIQALVETLESGALQPSESRDFLRRVHAEVHRMTLLVQDLLHLSRIESTEGALPTGPVDLADVLRQVCSAFEERAQAASVSLVLAADDELPRVKGQREMLRQVLVNLLDNALRFTPAAGRVTVTASVAEAGGQPGLYPGTRCGHRDGHRSRAPTARLRALLQGGPLARRQRHGPRPCHRPAHRPGSRGRGARREPRRAGKHLRIHRPPREYLSTGYSDSTLLYQLNGLL